MKLIFAWYDLWVGFYYDRKFCKLYFLPVPCVGVVINCRPIKKWYLEHWKYRHHNHEICCCGEQIGHGGSICYHGGCRSMKEYLITTEMQSPQESP